MTSTEINDKIQFADRLDFGDIFKESIELFKKSIVYGFVMQIIIITISLPILIFFYAPLIVSITAQSEYDGYNDGSYNNWLDGFSIFSMLLLIIGILIIGVLVMALRAGFFRILKSLDEGFEVSTRDLFYFFKIQHLSNLLLLLLATIVIAIVATMLLVLPLIYASVPISLMIVVYAFNPDIGINENIAISFKLGTKKWLLTFGLIVITTLLASMVGFLLCGIGMIFTAPFVYHPLYIIYKKVIGFENKTQPPTVH